MEDLMRMVELGAVEIIQKPLSKERLQNIWQHVVRKVSYCCIGLVLYENVCAGLMFHPGVVCVSEVPEFLSWVGTDVVEYGLQQAAEDGIFRFRRNS